MPFPFTNLTATKQRPAVVLSTEAFNNRQFDVLVAAVTSQIPPTLNPEEYLLPGSELPTAGLPKASIVRCAKVLTIDRRLIRKKLGQISVTALSQILQRLLHVLGQPQ